MDQIESFSISKLHVEEDFGFLRLVNSKLDLLPTTGNLASEDLPEVNTASLTAMTKEFQANFTAFDTAIQWNNNRFYTEQVQLADKHQCDIWRKFNAYVKAQVGSPKPGNNGLASTIRDIFKIYKDPTSLSMTERSGIIHNFLKDIESFAADTQNDHIDLKCWYDELLAAQTQFDQAVKLRQEIRSSSAVITVDEARKKVDATYKRMVQMINAMVLLNGIEPYADFVGQVNESIAEQKRTIRTRETRNANKDGKLEFVKPKDTEAS